MDDGFFIALVGNTTGAKVRWNATEKKFFLRSSLKSPEGSLPLSQVPATFPYPEPARSGPTPTSHFLKIHLNIIHPSATGSSMWFFPSGFPTKTMNIPLLSPICATCTAHFILLDFITRKIYGE